MSSLLVQALLRPEVCLSLQPSEWDRLIPQARGSLLLPALGARLRESDLFSRLPDYAGRHLESAIRFQRKQYQDLLYELTWLSRALGAVGVDLVLLKGAAYLVSNNSAAPGRVMSDIDILVPRRWLTDIETSLNQFGWHSGEMTPYDERYYRKWMHEIPPMGHRERGSTLDVHHTILPPTAGADLDASKLFEGVVETSDGIFTLSRVDMILHSAAHLFHEGEFHHGLRGLWDLDRLLREFSEQDVGFLDRLVERAVELDLVNSLYYGLRYARKIFGTPVPGNITADIARHRRSSRAPIMDFHFLRVLRPHHHSCDVPMAGFTRFCLYIRSHYLRMPLHLLLPHLIRKAWINNFGPSKS